MIFITTFVYAMQCELPGVPSVNGPIQITPIQQQQPVLFGGNADAEVGALMTAIQAAPTVPTPQVTPVVQTTAATVPDNPFMVDQLLYRSATLKILLAAIAQPPEKTNTNENTAELNGVAITPGDIRNGLLLVAKPFSMPHRYHIQFYKWATDPETGHAFLQPDARRNERVQGLFQTPDDIQMVVDFTYLTHTKPNSLLIGCEEVDTRCCGCMRNAWGKVVGKFKNDPMGTIQVVIQGIAKALKAAGGLPI